MLLPRDSLPYSIERSNFVWLFLIEEQSTFSKSCISSSFSSSISVNLELSSYYFSSLFSPSSKVLAFLSFKPLSSDTALLNLRAVSGRPGEKVSKLLSS